MSWSDTMPIGFHTSPESNGAWSRPLWPASGAAVHGLPGAAQAVPGSIPDPKARKAMGHRARR